ncbi:hypothetical protein BKA56DRAFT_683933 [Ilyonectria sp. MPI-CAGE-AT-0026]|nr:hypothetical protein BKA56DRAFT_683933 [Ilyonectria sp. MPI-CAGE-AT-0026]
MATEGPATGPQASIGPVSLRHLKRPSRLAAPRGYFCNAANHSAALATAIQARSPSFSLKRAQPDLHHLTRDANPQRLHRHHGDRGRGLAANHPTIERARAPSGRIPSALGGVSLSRNTLALRCPRAVSSAAGQMRRHWPLRLSPPGPSRGRRPMAPWSDGMRRPVKPIGPWMGRAWPSGRQRLSRGAESLTAGTRRPYGEPGAARLPPNPSYRASSVSFLLHVPDHSGSVFSKPSSLPLSVSLVSLVPLVLASVPHLLSSHPRRTNKSIVHPFPSGFVVHAGCVVFAKKSLP